MGEELIPWVEVNTWTCTACGLCCKGYRAPLKMDEYARITGRYGLGVVEVGLGKVYLRHGFEDRCIFQHPVMGRWACTIQDIKPLACKLFPFRILSKPVYRRGDGSGYRYRGRIFHIYLDPNCEGIVIGKPSERFITHVLPEVMELGLGVRWKQRLTTSKYISWTPQ